MAIEIRVLSGSRQGECVVLDVERFHVGSRDDCEVCFDPQRDPAIRGRSALIELTEDGWVVRCTGNGQMWVNQSPVGGQSRIRSGDLLRISEGGPDLSFVVVGRATSKPAAASPSAPGAAEAAAGALPPLSSSDLGVPAVEPARLHAPAASMPQGQTLEPTAAAAAEPVPTGQPATESQRETTAVGEPVPAAEPGRAHHRWFWPGIGVSIGAVLAAAGLMWWLLQDSRTKEPVALSLQEVSLKTTPEGSELRFKVPISPEGTLPGEVVFSLVGSPPAGIRLETHTGEFSWTPTETQGPAEVPVTVQIRTKGSDHAADETTFWIEVKEVNTAPRFRPAEDRRVSAGEEAVFSLEAADADLPPNKLSFGLVEAPAWVDVAPAWGQVKCTPGRDQDGDYPITVYVTDDGQPPLRDEMVVRIIVAGDPWRRVERELREVVYLTQVELEETGGSRAWPFATCVAIDESVLLTSAREAWQLAQWQKEGCAIWAVNPATGLKTRVKEIRVHRRFQATADKPGEWIYGNLGLLVSSDRLPAAAKMAGPEELGSLEEGLPLGCVGFSHQGEKITRFDSFQAELSRGSLFLVSTAAAGGRLLELKTPMPANAYGSPVVDQEGRVVGVFGETAPIDGAGVKNLQYATALVPELLATPVEWHDSRDWVRPALADSDP